jgi:hypothetical protein
VLLVVVEAFDSQAQVAISASLAMFIFFVYRRGTHFVAIKLGYLQVFLFRWHITCSEGCTAALERLLHLLVHVRDGYRAMPSIFSLESAPGAAPSDYGPVPGDTVGECSGRYTCRYTLSHSTDDS